MQIDLRTCELVLVGQDLRMMEIENWQDQGRIFFSPQVVFFLVVFIWCLFGLGIILLDDAEKKAHENKFK